MTPGELPGNYFGVKSCERDQPGRAPEFSSKEGAFILPMFGNSKLRYSMW